MERHTRPIARQPSGGRARTRDSRPSSRSCTCGGRDPCPSCTQRRKHAWRLVAVGGLSYEEAAARMHLTPGRVRLLVAQERDRQDLKKHKIEMIETELIRALLERELKRNPELRRGKLASWLDMEQKDLDVQLGYKPGKNGRYQRKIGVEAASRMVIALGRAPHELDGC